MAFSTLVALVAFLFPLAYSPGPGNSFFASVGAVQGLRGAMPSLFGYHAATFVVTILIGLGINLAFLNDPRFAAALAIAGTLYMFWLSYLFAKAAWATSGQEEETAPRGGSAGFVDGAMVLLLNPKAYAIIVLLFSQFLTSADDRHLDVLGITTIFTVNNFIAFIVWTLAGVAIGRIFRGPTSNRNLNLFFSACMFGVGLWTLKPIF